MPPASTANGFHLLRLPQLLLQDAALGDVFGKQFEDQSTLWAVGHGATRYPNHGGRAVLAFPFRRQPPEGLGGAQEIGQSKPLIVLRIKAENMLPNQFIGPRKA